MKKSFEVILKKGDVIQLFGNQYLHMMGIPIASGIVEHVRLQGDGFTFNCHETKMLETVMEGDGDLRIISSNQYLGS
jgi:hypothetical protein